MARGEKGSSDNRATVRFRFFDFELEGGNAAVENSIRNLAATLTRANVGPKRLASPTQPAALTAPDEVIEESGGEANEETEDVQLQQEAEDRPKRARKPPKMPKVLNDLDITSGALPLAQYCEEKKPSTLQEKFVALGTWFKSHRNQEEISVDHVFTCFHLLDWPRPDDIGSKFRDLKAKKQWFEKGSKRNFWRLTLPGLNYADNKLGKYVEAK